MISYQKNLFSPVVPCDSETFMQVISSPQVAETARKVAALREHELACTDEAGKRKLHDEQGRLKKKPARVPLHGLIPRRQAQAVRRPPHGLGDARLRQCGQPKGVFYLH